MTNITICGVVQIPVINILSTAMIQCEYWTKPKVLVVILPDELGIGMSIGIYQVMSRLWMSKCHSPDFLDPLSTHGNR